MKLELLAKLESLNKKLEFLGEKNYVPWFYLRELDPKELIRVLKSVASIDVQNNYYRYFIETLIYKILGDDESYLVAMENFNKTNKSVRLPLEYGEVLQRTKGIAT